MLNRYVLRVGGRAVRRYALRVGGGGVRGYLR